ncbi:MAG TPA: hypothetical protein LFW11_03470 [Rickettsia endosymbiont of Proechinophthirus fluctus]|nr:hypothetical protein [Rickettsia endosymbiont of Proechinophthirus fluctus]HJD54405.1 hypothetical protein [Rickettsia endosymbiont of Proechinophthirus fluctus]
MIVKTSQKTSSYFDSATMHFQNATKAVTDFTIYWATLATEHAINVIENGAKTVCSVQGCVSDVNNSNYSVVSTFAQATVASLATFAYYNPPVLIGAFTLGAILISPSD